MNAEGCEQLWRKHADALLLYATAILSDRNQAEDVLQVVFSRILTLEALPSTSSEAAYLFRAVRNEALNLLRAKGRAERMYHRLLEMIKGLIVEGPSPLEDRSIEIQNALFEIPREQREAVVLKIWGDLSFQEAASMLGVSEKTIEHRYYRGLAALKDEMDGRYE